MKEPLMKMRSQVKDELEKDILPFWITLIDNEYGGFYGAVSNDLKIEKTAQKGCILNSRILWTYSRAYRTYGKNDYRDAANKAFQFMKKAFWDDKFSGLYWMADFCGNPINKKKQIYNIAFGIYALSEYYRAFNDSNSLNMAILLYNLIEKYSFDEEYGGYIDAFSEQWEPISDMRLSETDLNASKTMNTHLHILEAYTNLYRVWKNNELKRKLSDLISLFLEKIIDSDSFHLKLYFTRQWESKSDNISYGHDIECSWLLCEAAEIVENKALHDKAMHTAINIADKVLETGYDEVFGGIYNAADSDSNVKDFNKDWWPQAEMVVGLINAIEISGKDTYLLALVKTWEFIYMNIIDHRYGEWFHTVERNGKVIESFPKVEPWKCPYHNARACMEYVTRCDRLLNDRRHLLN